MALKLLGTREQKENKAGNTGTKAVFLSDILGNKARNTKIEKILLGNKGTQVEIFLGTREHGTPWEAVKGRIQFLL